MRDKVFYSICFGFIVGVFVSSFFAVNNYFAVLLCFVFSLLGLFFVFISKNKWGIIASVFVFCFALGVLRFNVVPKDAPDVFESQLGQEGSFSGIIIDEPSIRENNQKLTVEIEASNEKTKALLTTDFDHTFRYGDVVNFTGKLQKPDNFLTDQGKDFDYINYLKKDGVFYLVSYPDIEIVSSGEGNIIKEVLFSFKNKFLAKINFAIPPPESLLLGGLILGERSSFDADMRQKFIDTGTIHIIALSGYNVTIVAEWIMKMFSFLPAGLSFGAGILGIILFVIMAGGQATAVRAGIMAVLALIARSTGRNYEVGRALVLAGVVMILVNPLILRHDVSFQLSFIATVAVIFLAPKTERYFSFITKKFGLRDIVAVTFSAYIFVLPFVLYKMGNLSLVALPANILILPLIPITMIFGFITGFLGLFWSMLAIPTGFVTYLLLSYELFVIDIFSKIPFASFVIPNFPLIIVIVIYAYFIYRLFGKDIKGFFVN